MGLDWRILAVDDEPTVAFSLRFVLERPGRHFSSACDGQEALTKIAAERFDLVITDNNMPGVDGLELVRRLRQQNFAGKIVVLSAYLSEEKMQAYADLDVDQMLDKPFDALALRRAIDEVAAA
jgi:CheY-like chemotaxis protein